MYFTFFKKSLLLSFLLIPCFVYSQTTSIFIKNKDNVAVEGSTVVVNNMPFITDASGKVEAIFTFPASIVVSHVGIVSIDTTWHHFSDTIDFILTDNNLWLKEAMITASWVNEYAAITQKTISRNELYSGSEAIDMPALLESLPGSVSTSDAGNNIGYSSLRIRGSDQTRINVMIDGVPINDAESQNVFWVDLPDLIEDVQSIQVQRGVGVSTAGPGAFGANINLRSGFLSDKPSFSLQSGFGSFNSYKLSSTLQSGTVAKYFRFKVRGSLISSDGYIDRAKSDLWSSSVQVQYIRSGFNLAGHFYMGKEKTYQAWNGIPYQFYIDDPATTYNPSGLKGDGSIFDDETDNYRQMYSRIIGRWNIVQDLDLQFTLYNTLGKGYYNQYREENIHKYFKDLPSQDVALVRERWLDNSLNGINVIFDYSLYNWKHQLGGNFQYYRGRHFGIIQNYSGLVNWIPREYYDNPATKQESSVFLRSENKFNKLHYFVDLQLRQLNYHYEGFDDNYNLTNLAENYLFFNPKVGASFFFRDDRSDNIYVYVGHGSKEPNRDDFKDAAFNKVPKPEKLLNVELGHRLYRPLFSIQTNVYYMGYQDQLVLTGQLNDVGAYTRFNVDKSYRAGIEVDMNYNWKNVLTFQGNISCSKNKILNFNEFVDVSEKVGDEIEYLNQEVIAHGNSDISFSPEIVGFGELGWKPFRNGSFVKNWKMFTNIKYVGKQYIDNTSNIHSELPAYNVVAIGMYLPIQLKKHRMDITFKLDNLFNKHYVNNGWAYRFKAIGYDVVTDDPSIQVEGHDYYTSIGYFPQAGRRFYLGAKYTF